MSERYKSFEFAKLENLTRFKNDTDFDCWINFKPIPPKRKLRKAIFVGPGKWVIFEHEIDPRSIAITFEEPETAFEGA